MLIFSPNQPFLILLLTIILLLTNSVKLKTEPTMLFPELHSYLINAKSTFYSIPESRKKELQKLSTFIQKKRDSNLIAHLTFICTHNSRRSHLSQIWAQAAAMYYGLSETVMCYSGGTEATAFNPRAVSAVERAGIKVNNPGGENPRYEVFLSEKAKPLICFSKRYNDVFNPQSDFAAIMTCDDADVNCPVVLGAEARIPIKYVDPKVSDGTELEAKTYDERCLQIATEMLYVFSLIN
jgi:arsenate reductase